jgi:FkbM family methyltransferase
MKRILINLFSITSGYFIKKIKKHTSRIKNFQQLNISFSQLGEDTIVQHIINENKLTPSEGIFIDAGAFDPINLSNTYALYLMGWRGINIDPNTESIIRFDSIRNDDININALLSDKEKEVYYNYYENAPTNKIASSKDELNIFGQLPIKTEVLHTTTLNNILKKNTRFKNKEIHFLNIDCEGEDLNVLKGIDLKLYQPKIICIEAHDENNANLICPYLIQYGYYLHSKILISYIFHKK